MAGTVDPGKVLGSITDWYIKLPIYQKIVFPLLLAGSVTGIIYISKWANNPDYAVLFSDVNAADSAAIIERLKELKIAYELRGDGTTVAVHPPSAVHELRITLAAEGIPRQGRVGYEIFDDQSFMGTTFQEQLKYLRAKEGELERTIGHLEAVRSVRVGIAQPEKSIFAKEAAMPTASVLLGLRPGVELTKQQLKGIANLVAGAVPRLTVDRVSIVDVYGNLLAPNEEEEEGLAAEATRLAYRREVEQGYVRRIEQMLSRVVGPDKVIARVTAEMDFSMSEREEEVFDPGGQVIRSERSVAEDSGGSARGGVPGVVSNLGDDPSLLAPPGTDVDNSNRRETVRNYEVSRAVTKMSAPRGQLVRLSVAVLVDGKYEAPLNAEAGAPKEFVSLGPEMLSQIESVVKSAVGFDSARGDTITVENVPFFVPEDKFSRQLEEIAVVDTVLKSVSTFGPYLLFVLFMVVLVRPLVKLVITPTDAEVDLTRLLPTGIAELEQELEVERKRAEVPDMEPAVDLEQLNDLIAENSQIVQANPEQAALLIRYWLNDGRM